MKKGVKYFGLIAFLMVLFVVPTVCFMHPVGGDDGNSCLFDAQNIDKAFDLHFNSLQSEVIDKKFVALSSNFDKGDIVAVYNTGTSGLYVLDEPCGVVIGGKFDGDVGMVLDGPVYCVEYNRYSIRWSDDYLEGWSAEDWLRKKTFVPSTKFNIGDHVEVCNTLDEGLYVRTDPLELAVEGGVRDGDQGVIIDGPFYGVPKGEAGLYHFWKVEYGIITGWCAEGYPGGVDYLKPVAVHDMAVTNVYPVPSSPYVGQSTTIYVTAKNEGSQQENNVPVKAYVDGVQVGSTQHVTLSADESETKSFSWTPSTAKTYSVKGEVGVVSGETETSDNTKTINVIVNPVAIHDMAVTDVNTEPASPYVGQSTTIHVTVKNEGSQQENYVPVKAYVGGVQVGSTQHVTLQADESETKSFSWTPSTAKTYSVKGEVEVVSGETETSDNEKTIKVSVAMYNPKLTIPIYTPTFQKAHAGTTVTYIIRVTNEGTAKDTIKLSLPGDLEWDLHLSETSVTLAPGESTDVYLYLTIGQQSDTKRITITGTSKDDISKTSSCTVLACNIGEGHGLFAVSLFFKNNDARDHKLNFNVPDYVKISDKTITLSPSGWKWINVVFDPKTSESGLSTIDIDVTDTTTAESATIPIEFGEFEINATTFDMATDSYSFPNWGPEIPIVNFELWGNCYGMSETSILYFMGMERPNNRPNTYMLTKDKPDNAKWKIRLHQWSGNAFLASVDIPSADNEKEYKALEKNISKGIPMLLNMQEFREWERDIRHTVVAYKIIKKGDKAYIFIYENEKTYDISKGTFYAALPYATYNLTTKEHEFDYTLSGSPFTKFIVREAERHIFEKNILVVECPVNVTVTDQYNRIISDDGTNEIPNASILPSNEQKLFYLPTDLTYLVNISAYDVGNFTLTKVSPITNNTASLNVFDNITTTNEMQATLEIAPNRTNPMKIDYNGDGHIDEEKNPDVNETIGMNQPPIASFTYSPPHPIVNQSITFNASASYDPDGSITNYKWNFGDGNMTNTTDPLITHTYVYAGNYTVNLTVTDDEGEYSYTESSTTIKESIKEPGFYVPDDYPSIQAAVDAANAGDTIIVRDGTYYEKVVVDKSLTIKSSSGSPEYTIVDAVDPYADVFSVTADHVNISGFTVTGAPDFYGIYLYNADYCDISDNICSQNAASGIYLSGSNSNSISNNTCFNNGMGGICLSSSTKNSIANNTCSNNGFAGIDLGCSNQNSISNNLCCNNKLGIFLDATNNNRIYLNNFINNDCNAYSCSSTNTWYSPLKESYSYDGESHTKYLGNYWSDYTGTDANKNGIGDSPYSIDDRGGDIDQDHYPLMTGSEHYFPSPTIPTPPTSTLTPSPRPTLTLAPRPTLTLAPRPTLTPTPRPTLRPTATLFI